MSVSDNHLAIECLHAGIYELHLSWRPKSPETEPVADQDHKEESPSEGKDSERAEIQPATRATDITKALTSEPKNLTAATKTNHQYNQAEADPTAIDSTSKEQPLPPVNLPPPPSHPSRLLYALEMFEAPPVAGWTRCYYGAGRSCWLRKLKPNVPHRVRVRSEAGVSQTFTFSTLPAPVSVSDLHRAVLLDRVERVEAILTRRPRVVSAVSAYGLSALMVAAREGFRSMSSLLLRRGADVDQSSQGAGKTALMFASFAGHLDIVDLLLSAGASVSSQDRSGRSALHHAADGGSGAVIRRLVAAGAPLEQADSEGWSPLMRAVMLGGPVSTLVEVGARSDGSDGRGRQLRRLSPCPLRSAELLSVWRRSALVLPPWRRSSSQQPAVSSSQQRSVSSSQQPARSSSQQPVRGDSQQTAVSSSQQPARSSSQQPERNSSQQPERNSSQQPERKDSQQPAVSSFQQPARRDSQQPERSSSQQPVRRDSQQMVRKDSKKLVRCDSKQLVRRDSQKPVRSDSQKLMRKDSQQPSVPAGEPGS